MEENYGSARRPVLRRLSDTGVISRKARFALCPHSAKAPRPHRIPQLTTPAEHIPAEKAWAVSADNLFEGADITYTTDETALPYTGQPVAMGVVSVIDATGETYTPGDMPGGEVDYAVRYFADTNHNKKFDAADTRLSDQNGGSDDWGKVAPTEVGPYFIVAMNGTGYKNLGQGVDKLVEGAGYVAKYFEVTTLSLEGAQPVNIVDAAKGTYVEGFTYDAAPQNVGFVVDGKLLEEGADGDYTVSYSTTDGNAPTAAGTYTAHLTGEGAYDGSKADVKFTVDKLDLSAATVVADVQEAGDLSAVDFSSTVEINGDESLTMATLIGTKAITWSQVRYHGADGKVYGVNDDGYVALADEKSDLPKGGYEFFAEAVTDDPNVVGEAYVTFNVVDEVVPADSFEYDDVALYDAEKEDDDLEGRVFDQSKGEAYDASLFSIAGEKDVDFTVTPSTEEGNTVGAHTAVVEVTIPSDYSIGGVATANFSVIAGVIDTAELDAVVILNGSNVEFGSTVPVPYTGEAVEPSISVSCNGTALTEGEDYTVTVVNDETGEAVESMVDAGTYTVTLASDTYTVTKPDSFKVQITQRDLGATVEAVEPVIDAQGNPGILHTGSAIDVEFYGIYKDQSDDPVVLTLDPSWYQLSGLQFRAEGSETYVPATEVLGVGDYKVNITPTPACANYTWDAKNQVEFSVVDTAYFTDVAADAWYSGVVYKAADLHYMTGVAGTKLFMPENPINRAELAQVLFNMAGLQRDLDGTYPTKFPDVESTAWYAQAIAWASAAGVVTGYEATGTFGPFDNATREAIATMMFRYAAAQGMDVSQRADLSAYADAESVSPWAEEAVEWAVAEGVMGVDTEVLNPQGDAQRAEVAAMSVRLQPVEPTVAPDFPESE